MGSTSKRARLTYNPKFKQPAKKGRGDATLLKQAKTLKLRKEKEGDTLWIKNAEEMLGKRMKKAGIKTA